MKVSEMILNLATGEAHFYDITAGMGAICILGVKVTARSIRRVI